jgi:hypothetical protein
MPGSTTELALKTAIDSDDNADYLTISLANSLQTIDALFNNTTGHTHSGARQGGPIGTASIPDGSITSAKIADGTIASADLASHAVSLVNNGAFGTGSNATSTYVILATATNFTLAVAADVLIFMRMSVAAPTPARPQVALRVDNATTFDGPRQDNSGNLFRDIWQLKYLTGQTAGAHSVQGAFRSYDANGTVNCDGGEFWVVALYR